METLSELLKDHQLEKIIGEAEACGISENGIKKLTNVLSDETMQTFFDNFKLLSGVNFQLTKAKDDHQVYYMQYTLKDQVASIFICSDKSEPSDHALDVDKSTYKKFIDVTNSSGDDNELLDIVRMIVEKVVDKVRSEVIEYCISINSSKSKNREDVFEEIESECCSDPLDKSMEYYNRSFLCLLPKDTNESVIDDIKTKAAESGLVIRVDLIDDEALAEQNIGVLMRIDDKDPSQVCRTKGVTVTMDSLFSLDHENERFLVNVGLYSATREENFFNDPHKTDRAIKVISLD